MNPADAQNLAELAVYAMKTGRIESAVRQASEATRLTPTAQGVWWLASHVHAMAGNRAAALEALTRALALGRSKADAAAAEELASLRDDPTFRRLVGE